MLESWRKSKVIYPFPFAHFLKDSINKQVKKKNQGALGIKVKIGSLRVILHCTLPLTFLYV